MKKESKFVRYERNSRKTKVVAARLAFDEIEKFDEVAEREGMTRSGLATAALRRVIKDGKAPQQ